MSAPAIDKREVMDDVVCIRKPESTIQSRLKCVYADQLPDKYESTDEFVEGVQKK